MVKPDEALPQLKLPLQPPIEPMLAQLTREMPSGGGWLYEPRWDGFRTLVFWDGEQLVMQSRDPRPLSRCFPEVEAGLRANLQPGTVVDGEVVIAGANGLDFDALLRRIHPAASRIKLLARELVRFLEPYRDLREREPFGRGPGGPSRWNQGRADELDWAPLRPELVCEVAFDHWQGDIPHGGSPEWGGRFRHGTTFVRWRPDKPPEQCTFEQLTFAVPIELEEIFGLRGKRLA